MLILHVFTRNVASRPNTEYCPDHWLPCIIGTNLLTKFHEDQTRNVASRVFTRTAPTTGGHVFQRTGTTFELNQHIIKTNILTNFELNRGIIETNLLSKFHEDRTRNMAFRVFTMKTAPPTGCFLTDRNHF
ncbi:hypothetical protein DPMN_060290 [Dreissena polymorpha]|uniref:Uncharacterized protein n=1 Tax=Dreissena polymorpha TaxID=45954 RepID=A0A9D4HFR4_DREPO|nr:hypothetical protein DPMN_060290 [Dreissena polymorpha]